jgi:channel protein (hemolysin III family)
MEVYAIPGFREPFNCFSHFLAAAVFGVLACRLIRRGWGHRGRVACLGVFALASVAMLSVSGVYHLLGDGGTPRAVMLLLDYAAIFVLIAATFTAGHGILFRGPARWGPLLGIWALAITGIALKTIFASHVPLWLGVALYLAMGWLGVFTTIALGRRYGFAFVKPVLWGAAAYTVGALLLWLRQPTLIPGVVGPHEVWHLAVIAGLGFHWKFVSQFAAGEGSPRDNK